MKPRIVMVVLELETDAGLIELRDKSIWTKRLRSLPLPLATMVMNVRQVTATVAQPAKEKKVKR